MIYSSKYEAILKMQLLYLVEKVGMKECSIDLLFFKLGTDHLVFWWGKGLLFPTA